MTYNILQGQNSPPCQYCILPSKMGISISTWAWKNDPKGQGSHGTKFPAHRLMGWDHEMCSRADTEYGVHSTRCGSPYGVESWKLVPSQSLFRCGSNRDFQPEGTLEDLGNIFNLTKDRSPLDSNYNSILPWILYCVLRTPYSVTTFAKLSRQTPLRF